METHAEKHRPHVMSVAYHLLGSVTAFEATMRASQTRRFLDGTTIAAPVTIGFGSRDWILLPWQSRHLDQLPADLRRVSLPRCGHVPMSDNPTAVTNAIAQGTQPLMPNRCPR